MESDIVVSLIKNGGIVAGISVVYFIIRLIMNRKNGNSSKDLRDNIEYVDAVKKTIGKVNELHQWHQPDSKGVQEWKNPHLAEAINNLADSIDKQRDANVKYTSEQTKVLQSMCVLLEKNTGKIDTIHSRINLKRR